MDAIKFWLEKSQPKWRKNNEYLLKNNKISKKKRNELRKKRK